MFTRKKIQIFFSFNHLLNSILCHSFIMFFTHFFSFSSMSSQTTTKTTPPPSDNSNPVALVTISGSKHHHQFTQDRIKDPADDGSTGLSQNLSQKLTQARLACRSEDDNLASNIKKHVKQKWNERHLKIATLVKESCKNQKSSTPDSVLTPSQTTITQCFRNQENKNKSFDSDPASQED